MFICTGGKLFGYDMQVKIEYITSLSQEEKAKLGLIRVHSDKFCWKKTQKAGILFAIMEMGDFQAVKKVMLVNLNPPTIQIFTRIERYT